MSKVLKLHNLSDYTAISHAISTKAFGSMKKPEGGVHHANLLKFAKSQNFPSIPICMHQVHGKLVAVVENDRQLVIDATDGLVTNKKGIPLAILTADCLPILFFDPENHVIGATHAGRRGLAAGVIHNTIHTMHERFDVDPKNIVVGIGPSIEKRCYEVSEEIAMEFAKLFPNKEVYEEKNGTFYLDLREVAVQSLVKEGILRVNIEVSDICTKCDDDFYSYRAGDENGRFVSVISLV